MNKIMFIGPVDKRLGPGIKNITTINYLKKKYDIEIINTYLQGKINGIINVIKFLVTFKKTIIAVSTGGRKVLIPLAFLKKMIFPKYEYSIIIINGYIIKELTSKNKILNFLLKKGLLRAKKVFVEINGLKKDLNKYFNIENVVVFPNFKEDKDFVNFDDCKNSKGKINEIKCAFLARVTKVKGIDIAIDSIIKLKEKGYKLSLDIFGPVDNDAKELINEIEKLDYINYKGIVANENVTQQLKEYNLFLFPTRHKREGFPASIIDAYSAGLPIIASDISYNSELVINGVNGSICEYDSVESLMNCVLEYINNNDKILDISKINFRKAQELKASIVFENFIDEICDMEW